MELIGCFYPGPQNWVKIVFNINLYYTGVIYCPHFTSRELSHIEARSLLRPSNYFLGGPGFRTQRSDSLTRMPLSALPHT